MLNPSTGVKKIVPENQGAMTRVNLYAKPSGNRCYVPWDTYLGYTHNPTRILVRLLLFAYCPGFRVGAYVSPAACICILV